MKLALDANYRVTIEGGHKIIPWLIMHSACVLNWYQVGPDGKTLYERWKGRRFRRTIAQFGECIMWLHLKSVGTSKLLYNEDIPPRWEEGIFLGILEESGQMIVGNEKGIFKCRDYRPKPPEER